MLKQITLLSLLSGVHIILAVADTAATATSGPLVGTDGKANCLDYSCGTGADWMVAALCAISKCNDQWPLAHVTLSKADLYHTEKVTVKTYGLGPDHALYTHDVSYTEGVATRNISSSVILSSDNGPDAWLGGAFDRAIENMGITVTSDGRLISHDTANSTATYEEAGLWGLTILTGQYSAKESVPADDATWLSWLKKSDGTPILIYTTDTPDAKLPGHTYLSVNTLKGDNGVVVWNPFGYEDQAYITTDTATLKSSTKYLYHLDWPHFVQL